MLAVLIWLGVSQAFAMTNSRSFGEWCGNFIGAAVGIPLYFGVVALMLSAPFLVFVGLAAFISS